MSTTATDDRPYRRIQFRIGEVLRLSFWVWVKNLVPFAALAMILQAPLTAWRAYIAANPEAAEPTLWYAFVVGLGLDALLTAAVTYGVVMALERRTQPMARVITMGLRRMLPAIVVTVVAWLLIMLGAVLLIVPGVILACSFYVAVPTSVVERPGLRGAFARSRHLTAGNRVAMLGLLVVSLVLRLLLGVAIGLPLEGAGPVAHFVADLAHEALFEPLFAAIVATAYVLLRRQRDGASADELAAVFA